MPITFPFGHINLPQGSNDLPVQTAPVDFTELKLQLTFTAFPNTATFGYSQFISRDGSLPVTEPYGAATIGDGVTGLTDKNGNPTLNWFFVASTPVTIPAGAKVRVHIDNPQNLDVASGVLTLT